MDLRLHFCFAMRKTFPPCHDNVNFLWGAKHKVTSSPLQDRRLSVWGAQLARSSGAMADSLGRLWETGPKTKEKINENELVEQETRERNFFLFCSFHDLQQCL